MNIFNVVILKLPALYEILSEIKLEFNFNIINFNENNEEFKKFIEDNNEALVISSDHKGNYKNFIFYKKVFKLKILIEHINVIFSKRNFSVSKQIYNKIGCSDIVQGFIREDIYTISNLVNNGICFSLFVIE